MKYLGLLFIGTMTFILLYTLNAHGDRLPYYVQTATSTAEYGDGSFLVTRSYAVVSDSDVVEANCYSPDGCADLAEAMNQAYIRRMKSNPPNAGYQEPWKSQ